MIMTTLELLERHPEPTREQTVDALGGVLCRCTGYVKIIESVEESARLMAAERRP
jgi:aerobic-type carbon monoxide dehydrogenase small subunit (CoxS/CutS family)